ncbi:alpha/beta fold hydrolase [Mitsuaria sp. WAJ17]|uniref:alpha/beta fold hydrolase n=1 Tax=Mitsuaria sp. WAJ17 TaxID=2761452 RepID=UPI0016018143|nr:alpha/beta hydrolase [Mitsuaria sp. WAJ17]MBB2486105.1 alpha/beta fold hydrolase [Mitsuaria sp. WAJ17]
MPTRPSFMLSLLVCLSCLTGLAGCSTVQPSASTTLASGNEVSYFWRHGSGPVVIFQSGLGDDKNVWASVIEKLPVATQVLSYDRPGYGGSPLTSGSRDPCSIADELQQLIRRLGLNPPFILVGHSLGGLYQYSYAQRHPEEVIGLVLIDPTHPDHLVEMKRQAPAHAAILSALRYSLFTPAMRQEFDGQSTCTAQLKAENAVNRPLHFLFSGRFRMEEQGAFERMVRALRAQWLSMSPNAEAREVATSGHYIQKEEAGRVAEAISQLLAKSRAASAKGQGSL